MVVTLVVVLGREYYRWQGHDNLPICRSVFLALSVFTTAEESASGWTVDTY